MLKQRLKDIKSESERERERDSNRWNVEEWSEEASGEKSK
jgi:hypothetical protein